MMGRLEETVGVAREVVIQDDAASRSYQGGRRGVHRKESAEGGGTERRQSASSPMIECSHWIHLVASALARRRGYSGYAIVRANYKFPAFPSPGAVNARPTVHNEPAKEQSFAPPHASIVVWPSGTRCSP